MTDMLTHTDFKSDIKPVWCPGCGDFGVVNALTKALARWSSGPRTWRGFRHRLLVANPGLHQLLRLPRRARRALAAGTASRSRAPTSP